jgi:hypothetical protein
VNYQTTVRTAVKSVIVVQVWTGVILLLDVFVSRDGLGKTAVWTSMNVMKTQMYAVHKKFAITRKVLTSVIVYRVSNSSTTSAKVCFFFVWLAFFVLLLFIWFFLICFVVVDFFVYQCFGSM